MIRDADVKLFLRAADQRLLAAEILFENQLFLDATYLGGYAPECALKALLLSQMPEKARQSYMKSRFRGVLAHNIDWLCGQLRRWKVSLPLSIIEAVQIVQMWSPEMRYGSGLGIAKDTRRFLNSTRTILDWVKRSL